MCKQLDWTKNGLVKIVSNVYTFSQARAVEQFWTSKYKKQHYLRCQTMPKSQRFLKDLEKYFAKRNRLTWTTFISI